MSNEIQECHAKVNESPAIQPLTSRIAAEGLNALKTGLKAGSTLPGTSAKILPDLSIDERNERVPASRVNQSAQLGESEGAPRK